jgi:arylsulfatase A-like enzyme
VRRCLSMLVLLACAGPAAGPAPRVDAPSSAPNVVIVLCDTLRADALGVHGATRPGVTPRIDAFAAESLVFDRAITPNAWTVPSVASLFTSAWPQTHGVLRFREFESVDLEVLDPAFVTVAEVFRANGWRTGALLKTGVVTASHGFAQGFDHFERLRGDIAAGRSGAQLTGVARGWVDTADTAERPFFLYLHYMDPHTPYQPPPPLPAWTDVPGSAFTGAHYEVARLADGRARATDADRARLRALYDAEVQTFDAAFGDLLARLDATARPTIVVLVADHGEQLDEHGGWLHQDLWPENVHVPWMIRAPGLAPTRVPGPVSTVDLAPTLTALAGLPTPAPWQGQARVRRAGRGFEVVPGGDRPVFAEYADQRAVWSGGRAWIDAGDRGGLFAWEEDPRFLVDRAAEEADRVAAAREQIRAHEAAAKAAGAALRSGRGRVGAGGEEGVERALRELGYVE